MNKLPKCLWCKKCEITGMFKPVYSEVKGVRLLHPCLEAGCHASNVHKDAYGFPQHSYDLIIDLTSGEAWIDGSSTIPEEGCSAFEEGDFAKYGITVEDTRVKPTRKLRML